MRGFSPTALGIWNIALRFVCASIFCAFAVHALRQGVAAWLSKDGSLDRVRRAQKWDPSDPTFAITLGEDLAKTSGSAGTESVRASLLTAMQLGPNRALNWLLLDQAQQAAGDDAAALESVEHALKLFPNSPKANWLYANCLIRTSEPERALGPLRLAMQADPALESAAFDLAWRSGLQPQQILQCVPLQQHTLAAYLDFLVITNRLDAAAAGWTRVGEVEVSVAFRYFDALLRARQVDAMAKVWSDLAARDPQRVQPLPDGSAAPGGSNPAASANLVINGGFEAPVLNGGFDWRLVSIEGAETSIDRSVAHNGARSLQVRFDGSRNLDFHHVVQYILVSPGTAYTFTAYVRGENLTTDSGPGFAIYDAFDNRALSLETVSLIGTFDWTEQSAAFTTGVQTRLIVIQLRRPPSQKLDNLISGTVWLDDVSLVPARECPAEKQIPHRRSQEARPGSE